MLPQKRKAAALPQLELGTRSCTSLAKEGPHASPAKSPQNLKLSSSSPNFHFPPTQNSTPTSPTFSNSPYLSYTQNLKLNHLYFHQGSHHLLAKAITTLRIWGLGVGMRCSTICPANYNYTIKPHKRGKGKASSSGSSSLRLIDKKFVNEAAKVKFRKFMEKNKSEIVERGLRPPKFDIEGDIANNIIQWQWQNLTDVTPRPTYLLEYRAFTLILKAIIFKPCTKLDLVRVGTVGI
ncbi:hypothetical protein TIFTF001_035089 [Ficus carica]|uniref:Uncharacterized protein n=1 Tax=Ficus carica TaxID=3494 RepID=A0AA88E1P1_FICCA|nr:hypothetical protein TIFTF001_035089 [Ficus carica]